MDGFNWYTQREQIVQTMAAIHMDRLTTKPVYFSIQSRQDPYIQMGGLSSTSLVSSHPAPPEQTLPSEPVSVPIGILQDFEHPDCFYHVFQCTGSLSSEVKYSGNKFLKMTGTGGTWHTIGIYLYGRPIDLSGFSLVGVWVYDTVGNNTLEIRLTDQHGNTQAIWTNERSRKNAWRLLSNSLSSYTNVDLTCIVKIELCEYNDGIYYFDDLKVW